MARLILCVTCSLLIGVMSGCSDESTAAGGSDGMGGTAGGDGGTGGTGGTAGSGGVGGVGGSGGHGGTAGDGGTGGAGGGSAVPTEGLLAHYPFSGDARDHSGNGYDGTVDGPVLVTDRFGTSRGAYSFDGVDDVIGLPHEPELDDGANAAGSLGAWVYRTTDSWPLHIAGKRQGCGGGSFMQLAIGSGGVPTGLVPLNEWIYLTVTWDGSTITHYAEGAAIFSAAFPPWSNAAQWTIGTSGTCQRFGGLIDDVRIFSRSLDSSEVQQLVEEGGWVP